MSYNPYEKCAACGSIKLETVDWCIIDKEKCSSAWCPGNMYDSNCGAMEVRIICKACGANFETE